MPGIDKNQRKNRRRYWFSASILFFFALVGWLRFQQTLRYWYTFIELDVWPHPLYSAITGGLIGIGYGLALIFHLSHITFTPRYIRILGVIFLAWIWFDRVWIAVREAFISLLPITILITVCTIGLDVLLIHKITYKMKHDEQS